MKYKVKKYQSPSGPIHRQDNTRINRPTERVTPTIKTDNP